MTKKRTMIKRFHHGLRAPYAGAGLPNYPLGKNRMYGYQNGGIMKKRFLALFLLFAMGSLMLSGCGAKQEQASPGSKKGAQVSIKGFAFTPAAVTVKKGDSVTWTNNDSPAHTVTANDGDFDSGELSPGESFTQKFAKAGTFAYHCEIHASMTGTVTVK